jgi:DNA/RNA endonuclease YhcR with UshA esterase domain
MPEGRFRRALRRLTAEDDELEAEALASRAGDLGACAIADAPVRTPVCVHGTLQSVTLRPRGGVPALEAELYDGTATVYVVWLGRRRIEGIRAGASMVVEGRLAESGGRRTIYNPAYRLLPQRGT